MGQEAGFYAEILESAKEWSVAQGACMEVQAFSNVGRLDFDTANYTIGYVKVGFVCLDFFSLLS